jgi:acyl-CoA thioester hydrolase
LTLPLISVDTQLRVPFFDVDSMRIVWHGHYCKYLEVARCNLLDHIGYNYTDMAKSGYGFPIVDMQIKYIQPLVFEQDVCVRASLLEYQYRLKIGYLITDANTGAKLTKAHTVQAAVEVSSNELRLECPAVLQQQVARLLAGEAGQ